MAEQVSVKERIELQLQRDLMAEWSLPIENVQRLEEENEASIPTAGASEGVPPEVWITLDVEDEDEMIPGEPGSEDAAQGSETMDLPFVVSVHLTAKPPSTPLMTWANRHIAKAKHAVMNNNQRQEAVSNQPLALMTLVSKPFGPIKGDKPGEYVVGVEGVIKYRHPEGDPYTVG